MTVKFYLLIISILWYKYQPDKNDFNYCKVKAKSTADSIVFSLVDKNKFKHYFEFKNDFNSYIIEKGSNMKVFWNDKFQNKPSEYHLTYLLKKSEITNAEFTIVLDSIFRLHKMHFLPDKKYFKDIYLSQKKIVSLVNSFNFKDITSVKYIYDTIQNSKTFRPFIEVSTFFKSSKGNFENCSTIIDSTYKIDPGTSKVIKRYVTIIKSCSH